MKAKITEILTANGNLWKVAIKGDELMLIDHFGRCRHRSQGHNMTGVFLAMEMAGKPMPISANCLDKVLQDEANEFLK